MPEIIYYLVCIHCLADKRMIRLQLDSEKQIYSCPKCRNGYTSQLLQALTGFSP